ncbi:DNA repair protein RecN [Arthrobacter sp. H14]|uniref:DNA repair protein RecN n=1 Tax=Arthrobacter sp. H14 TaxID=1312959 RepID=UPI000479D107|nr:DNA repair protein RecN [Arthrobacter sp. H14]
MIEQIHIRDLGVISEATLTLGPGLSVVTGETGAGKTMVVTALGLLLGARSDAGAVRTGAKSALAEAVVRVSPQSSAALAAIEAGGEVEEYDDGAELLLARTVGADGRSRAHVGGRSAPVGVLGRIGADLVAVHGQSDQLRLRSSAAQREALDKFAGEELVQLQEEYGAAYSRWRTAATETEELRSASRERIREAGSLQSALEEIDGIDPQPGEDRALKAESIKLTNMEELRTAANVAGQSLTADVDIDTPDAATLVDAAKRTLEQVAEHDESLRSAAERLAEVGYIITDVAGELSSYAASLDGEGPDRLAEVEERRANLGNLIRKYAPTIDEVLEWAETSRARLDDLTDDSSRIEALDAEVVELEQRLVKMAAQLTALRMEAGKKLSERVSAELSALAMPDAALEVRIEDSGQLGPHGADVVELLLQPHAGAPARPLGKGASGGELSRVMLAIEVVLAEVDPVPTFVFDEVDAGVGGRAAVEIGRRLAMLAKHVQVLVVTHLPQVAAFADQHITVIKTSDTSGPGGVTASDVRLLDDAERVKELARMLAGQEDSSSAQAHAQELLQDARMG